MEVIKMNCRGQAAVTDALYFLMIVTALCIFMYSFANGYGGNVSEQISKQYVTDYATAALKTILYSSVPREVSKDLYTSDIEVDYLMAYLKEDYAEDKLVYGTSQGIDEETKLVLARNISDIMKPLADTSDYIFYVSKGDTEFVYTFLHLSEFTIEGGRLYGKGVAGEPGHIDYLCFESNDNTSDKRALVDKLVLNVGNTSPASSRIQLLELDLSNNPVQVGAQADFVMWPAAKFEGLFDAVQWQCKKINWEENKLEPLS